MTSTRTLTAMAMFIAIGTLGAQILWFPTGVAKAYPVQHAVNVMVAVTLGPFSAVTIAFCIGLLRFFLGLGTFLAFPGGMIGALLAGLFYKFYRKKGLAVLGEITGTGVIGAIAAVPFAQLLMGTSAGVFAFVPPFLVSSISGAMIGWFILSRLKVEKLLLQL